MNGGHHSAHTQLWWACIASVAAREARPQDGRKPVGSLRSVCVSVGLRPAGQLDTCFSMMPPRRPDREAGKLEPARALAVLSPGTDSSLPGLS